MWFTEGIAKALNKSRSEQLLLVVYIEGKNDLSNTMTSQLETDESIRTAIGAKAIALKLIEHSENATMFTRIYPEKPAPTVYLISHLGVLLTSFSETLDKELFLSKLNESSVASPTVQAPVATRPSAAAVSPASSASSVSPSTSDNQPAQADNKTIEEKKAAMLERIKENREKNKKQDEERARNQEMERIRAGKEMQKLKQQIAEQEAKEAIKEREKDARLGKLERERVLRALEEDQKEKKARFEQERLKREAEYEKYKQSEQEKNNTLKQRVIKLEENEIRIQFKLPDGNSLVTKFKLDDTLQSAVDFLRENSTLGAFQLAITYPKRNFGEQDFATTFTGLGLKNSVVFLVIEISTGAANKSVATDSVFNQIWTLIASVCTMVFTMIAGLFSSLFGNAGDQTSTDGQTPAASTNEQAPNKPGPSRSNERDNFRTFRNERRDGDENNTYNGNSTEQQ